jgi:hypothetical protein
LEEVLVCLGVSSKAVGGFLDFHHGSTAPHTVVPRATFTRLLQRQGIAASTINIRQYADGDVSSFDQKHGTHVQNTAQSLKAQ